MKTTKTFKDAALRTVNRGYIELDCNGKIHCFNDASIISINKGIITIETDWKPERGELIKITGSCIDSYSIFDSIEEKRVMRTFGYKRINGIDNKLQNDFWFIGATTKISPVTLEEQQAFDDFCKSKGKIWNKEKFRWEKYRWKPQYGDDYYRIAFDLGKWTILKIWWSDLTTDINSWQEGNCFQTKEEAEAKLEQIKKLLLEV